MKIVLRICVLAALLIRKSLVSYSQRGFISLDCGGSGNFTDSTGIQWVSDERYISVGEQVSLSNSAKNGLARQQKTLRRFPDQNKNCYELRPVQINSKYLLRATFLYDSYDDLDSPPKITLILDVDIWDSFSLDASKVLIKEIVFLARFNPTNVCLAKRAGNGVPIISSLELRPLQGDMYGEADENYNLLKLERTDFGVAVKSKPMRYPDDPFDRIWSTSHYTTPIFLSTNENVSMGSALDRPPSRVMQTAITSPTSSPSTLTLDGRRSSRNGELYFSLYFAEIGLLNNTDIREFELYLDGQLTSSVIRPKYLESTNVSVLKPYGISNNMSLSLRTTERSNMPPLINAIEIYRRSILRGNSTSASDVDALRSVQQDFNFSYPSGGDPCLPPGFSWEWLSCNNDASPRIVSLNLSNKGLSGSIPSSISALIALEILDLSRNHLNGAIPAFLANLTHLQKLILDDNSLSGPVPDELLDKENLFVSVSGNPLMCEEGEKNCYRSKDQKVTVIGSSVAAAMLLAVILLVTVAILCKRRRNYTENGKEDSLFSARRFGYKDVKEMTRNFSKQIGRGAFGPIYYGCLTDGTQVAVKMLSKGSKHGKNEFLAEVSLLSTVRHKSLISLVGFCCESKYRVLVYEYMCKGSLDKLLQGQDRENTLPWEIRVSILLNAAQGLEYLHSGCNPPVVHRDVKASNILLNERMEAKLSDFGLARRREAHEKQQHVSTEVKGTFGYLDPEYTASSKLTEKSDVYSFGVVVFEMITGRTAIDTSAETSEKRHVVSWVRSMISTQNFEEIWDQSIVSEEIDKRLMWRLAELGTSCTETFGSDRPSMKEVVNELKQICRMVVHSLPSPEMLDVLPTPAPR